MYQRSPMHEFANARFVQSIVPMERRSQSPTRLGLKASGVQVKETCIWLHKTRSIYLTVHLTEYEAESRAGGLVPRPTTAPEYDGKF